MQCRPLKILFAASEAYPLIKTGGLADVAGSLPRAISDLNQDICLVLPAYPDAVAHAGKLTTVANLTINNTQIEIKEGLLPLSRVRLLLVDCPQYFDRQGNPYSDDKGEPWPDNAERFYLFSQAIVSIAMDNCGLDWCADLVHCNDWQTGLVPALLASEERRPVTLFTVHNLAYQGIFPHEKFVELGLSEDLWSPDALEFYDQLSFIKGGLVFADRINTVSPAYAREIQTKEFGCGLDGLLRDRSKVLSGILNGIDTDEWDPTDDVHLESCYSWKFIKFKYRNKQSLQQELGLPDDGRLPLIGSIGRLVEQKGIDLIMKILPALVKMPLQMVFLGSGNPVYEKVIKKWAAAYPHKIAAHIGYDEKLAHRIEAGADMFLMPSQFEPCGLNQLYSLCYGTIPIVNKVGGLADTVIHTDERSLKDKTANGIVISKLDKFTLLKAIQYALDLYANKDSWKQIQLTAMQQEFSWVNSARDYLELYQELTPDCNQQSA